MTLEVTCPICRVRAARLDTVGDAAGFECENHGRFRVADSVFAIPALSAAPRERWEAALQRAQQRQPDEATITIYDFD
jgi:hypothetical protein